MESTPSSYTYSNREVILYNIAVGARRTQLDLVYEDSTNFQALPTFGVVPTYYAEIPWKIEDIVPNHDGSMILHGEQFLEIKQFPIPTFGTLKTQTKLVEVVNKGNATLVRHSATTVDETDRLVFYNERVSFIRGSGMSGGQSSPLDRGAATALNNPPSRPPDRVVEEKTSENVAALFRLLGDRHPLHIDTKYSAASTFGQPILHGLATFGIAGKHVFETYGPYKNIKARFSGIVLPGQTIITKMWEEAGSRIVYRAEVKETGRSCISNAAVELLGSKPTL